MVDIPTSPCWPCLGNLTFNRPSGAVGQGGRVRGDVVVVCLVFEDKQTKSRCPITLFCTVRVSAVSLTGWDDGQVAGAAQGSSQLSIDVVWIHVWTGTASTTWVCHSMWYCMMAYDKSSQVLGPCIALTNPPSSRPSRVPSGSLQWAFLMRS